MGNDKRQDKNTESEISPLGHGPEQGELIRAEESFLKHIESLQHHLNLGKNALRRILKQKGVAEPAMSDDSTTLSVACENLQKTVRDSPSIIGQVQEAIGNWRIAERGSRRVRFEAAARDKNWVLFGNWPEPVVSGIVFLTVNEEKEKASVNGRPVGGMITAEKLIEQIEIELQELERNKTDPVKFIGDLWRAYKLAGGKINEGIMVFDLLRELLLIRQSKNFLRNPTKASFRPYPVVQFRADLTSYLSSGAPSVHDKSSEFVLDIVGGSYAENGLYMYFPQSGRLGTCGRITFRPA